MHSKDHLTRCSRCASSSGRVGAAKRNPPLQRPMVGRWVPLRCTHPTAGFPLSNPRPETRNPKPDYVFLRSTMKFDPLNCFVKCFTSAARALRLATWVTSTEPVSTTAMLTVISGNV